MRDWKVFFALIPKLAEVTSLKSGNRGKLDAKNHFQNRRVLEIRQWLHPYRLVISIFELNCNQIGSKFRYIEQHPPRWGQVRFKTPTIWTEALGWSALGEPCAPSFRVLCERMGVQIRAHPRKIRGKFLLLVFRADQCYPCKSVVSPFRSPDHARSPDLS
jgi:hypothetical protein